MYCAPERTDKISVIICNFNGSRYLASLIQALSDSSAPIVEVIVIDDASTDDPERIYDDISARSRPFELCILKNPVNKGASASRNRGIRKARGNVLAFVDPDAMITPYTIPQLWANLRAEDCVFPTTRFPDGEVLTPTDEFDRLLCLNSVLFLMRRSALDVMDEWFDEKMEVYYEDIDFFLRAHTAGVLIRHVPEVVIQHPRPESYSAARFYMAFKNSLYMTLKIRGIIPFRHSFAWAICRNLTGFLVMAVTGMWIDSVSVPRKRIDSSRFKLLYLYFRAIAWNMLQTGRIIGKRKKLKLLRDCSGTRPRSGATAKQAKYTK